MKDISKRFLLAKRERPAFPTDLFMYHFLWRPGLLSPERRHLNQPSTKSYLHGKYWNCDYRTRFVVQISRPNSQECSVCVRPSLFSKCITHSAHRNALWWQLPSCGDGASRLGEFQARARQWGHDPADNAAIQPIVCSFPRFSSRKDRVGSGSLHFENSDDRRERRGFQEKYVLYSLLMRRQSHMDVFVIGKTYLGDWKFNQTVTRKSV